MKVEQNKSFEPITITLETEEEATYLWVALNVSANGISANYKTSQLEEPEDIVSKSHEMWSELNHVFNPTEK